MATLPAAYQRAPDPIDRVGDISTNTVTKVVGVP